MRIISPSPDMNSRMKTTSPLLLSFSCCCYWSSGSLLSSSTSRRSSTPLSSSSFCLSHASQKEIFNAFEGLTFFKRSSICYSAVWVWTCEWAIEKACYLQTLWTERSITKQFNPKSTLRIKYRNLACLRISPLLSFTIEIMSMSHKNHK